MSVEVERKFVCDADIQKKLKEIGAVCIGQSTFQDQYFDSPDFHLTLRDVWLRRRQGCWELKCPTVTKAEDSRAQPRGTGLCSRYKEIINLPEIQLKVREVMKEAFGEPDMVGAGGCDRQMQTAVHQERSKTKDTEDQGPAEDEDSWLLEWNLVCFAEFTTVRQSFTLKEEGVRVDLDQADFGYCVGEIEVLVPEGEDVQAALKMIDKTAQNLGLAGDQKVKGKMDVYLQRCRPEHYAKLLSVHIL